MCAVCFELNMSSTESYLFEVLGVARDDIVVCGAVVPEFQFGEVVSLSLLVIETKF